MFFFAPILSVALSSLFYLGFCSLHFFSLARYSCGCFALIRMYARILSHVHMKIVHTFGGLPECEQRNHPCEYTHWIEMVEQQRGHSMAFIYFWHASFRFYMLFVTWLLCLAFCLIVLLGCVLSLLALPLLIFTLFSLSLFLSFADAFVYFNFLSYDFIFLLLCCVCVTFWQIPFGCEAFARRTTMLHKCTCWFLECKLLFARV